MNAEHRDMTERTVLGAMLGNHAALAAARELIPDVFYLDSHRRIFTRMQAMLAQDMPVDLVTLSAEMGRTKELDGVGGSGYLMDLTLGVPRNMVLAGHLAALRKEAARRQILALCEIVRTKAEEGGEPSDLLAEMTAGALATQMQSAEVRPAHLREFVVPFLEALEHQRAHAGDVLGVSSGIPMLDACTTGWRDGEMTLVGALPGRGKTSFLLQAMYHAAREGVGVGCISLEMRAQQLLRRLAVYHSGLSSGKLRDARTMNASEYQHVRRAAVSLGDLPIEVVDQSGLRPGQIASVARQMRENGAGVIFVDFIQIIHEDGRDRREAINRVSASLRDTCKTLNLPFVVASQLARRDADPNRRPTMQDLRESGNLEQDAHNVLMLFRPKDKGTSEWTGEDEILIEKQREGVTGMVPVRYDDQKLMFVTR